MGKMASKFANIFMWNFERHLLDNCAYKPFLYLRYVYDIFVIWQHGEEKLEQFHEYVTNIHPNIKLTLMSSATSISYLDVYRLMAPIYRLTCMQSSLTDMDTSITKAFTKFTSKRELYVLN